MIPNNSTSGGDRSQQLQHSLDEENAKGSFEWEGLVLAGLFLFQQPIHSIQSIHFLDRLPAALMVDAAFLVYQAQYF